MKKKVNNPTLPYTKLRKKVNEINNFLKIAKVKVFVWTTNANQIFVHWND